MVQLISKTMASGYLGRYYNMLTATGYVGNKEVQKYLVYLFLIDMVEYMHAFIDEKDYKTIERALKKVFTNGNCLLPYPVFCVRKATLGRTDYLTNQAFRITEDDIHRITEDELQRIA